MTPAKVVKAAAKLTRVKRQSGKVGPGDAGPPGVADQEPALHDEEGAAAPEEQLGHS